MSDLKFCGKTNLGSRFSSPWKTSPFSVPCFQGAPSQGRGAKKRSCHRRPQIEGYCLLVGSNERFEVSWKSAEIQPSKNGPISARAKTGPTGGFLQSFFDGLGSALFARRGDSWIKRVCLQRSAKPLRNCDRAKCIFFWRDVPRSGTCGNGPTAGFAVSGFP